MGQKLDAAKPSITPRHAEPSFSRQRQHTGPRPASIVNMNSQCSQQTHPSGVHLGNSPPDRAQFFWSRRRRSRTTAYSPLALLLLLSLLTIADAVRVPISDCLPDSYQNNDPKPLQFVPLFADAKFGNQDDNYNLELIVWGNVTGSYNQVDLPPLTDPYWKNPNETNGKIVRTPEPNVQNPKATTLNKRVDFLTYEPYHEAVDFCLNGLVNASCPLAPHDPVDPEHAYLLPSFNITREFGSSYALGSFAATFVIIYGDTAATGIGCASTTITPDLGSISTTLGFFPGLILLITGFAVIFASIWSPWGSTDPFHWTSNYGRDADLLRLVTPGFGDCLQYIQFIVLSGSLSLNYPGYFQPVASRVGWSSLMFDESFVTNSPSWKSVVDGVYVTNGNYGLHRVGQLLGMANPDDIWAGMMVYLCVIIAGVFVITQIGFAAQWVYRKYTGDPEEDLVAKNIPFSIGNIIRIVYNFFLMPIVALSAFQLVITSRSPTYTVALAAVTLVLLIVFATWLLFVVIRTRPRSILFDDLPTVLRYGPLYNTFSDDSVAYSLITVLLNFVRGLAVGAVQPSGIAQVVLLAICEVIQIFTLYAFRPFGAATSMNVYHSVFSALRLAVIMLMVAFAPSLGVTEAPKGWIGYAILLIHGVVLVLGFFLSAVQTIVEVIARLLGAGGDDARGLTRGGLSKIFGARQLSRRATPRPGPSRQSQLSTAAMLDPEDASKAGYSSPNGRIRSESAGSMGALIVGHRQRPSSGMDSIDMYSGTQRNPDTASSYTPGTPGQASTFSFLTSPTAARQASGSAIAMESPDPYYRPPRRRGNTLNDSFASDGSPIGLPAAEQKRSGHVGPVPADGIDPGEISRGPTPAPQGPTPMTLPPNRPDYATREVDFYYGVRGPALKSAGPGRKLGTGPADPTGPIATATGWFRTMMGGKSKDKSKGFEVVRSSRMPPGMMARNGAFGDETPPEGIPVAMGVLRNGPIDSDDEDDHVIARSPKKAPGNLLTEDGEPGSDPDAESPVAERAPQIGDIPGIARTESHQRRKSGFMDSSASASGDNESTRGEQGGNDDRHGS